MTTTKEFDPLVWLRKYAARRPWGDYFSLCPFCTHFKENYTCRAFPKGIPQEFLFDACYHLSKTKNQKGDDVFTLSSKFKSEE